MKGLVTLADKRLNVMDLYKDYRLGKALEVGTFTGMGSMAMRLAGMQVKTIDVTYEFLQRCKNLWSVWHIDFHKMSGEDELKSAEKYDVIFHDSYHGDCVIPELCLFFKNKLNKGGKLIVHDVDALNIDLLLTELGNLYPKKKLKHTVTTDYRGRQLGTFWV